MKRAREKGDQRPTAPRGMRKVSTRGETWYWRYGHSCSLQDPRGGRRTVSLAAMCGQTEDQVEMGYHEGACPVTPSMVVNHIDRAIRGYDDVSGFPVGSPWHGVQMEARKGWTPFAGPRGIWQAKIHPWVVDILTPEGVAHQVRTYDVLGLTISEWTDMKVADMKVAGTTLDEMYIEARSRMGGDSKDKVRMLMEYDAPSIPRPTVRQLEAHAARAIVGKAAFELANAA